MKWVFWLKGVLERGLLSSGLMGGIYYGCAMCERYKVGGHQKMVNSGICMMRAREMDIIPFARVQFPLSDNKIG